MRGEESEGEGGGKMEESSEEGRKRGRRNPVRRRESEGEGIQ